MNKLLYYVLSLTWLYVLLKIFFLIIKVSWLILRLALNLLILTILGVRELYSGSLTYHRTRTT